MSCSIENRKQVKLETVTNAAIVDLFEDGGKMFQRASFMAARGLKKLYTEALPKVKHKAWLIVNQNTHTATLPLDWENETFVGYVDERWRKVPLRLNNQLTDTVNIVDVPCESPCAKCGQDTSICNDLVVTEETINVVINNNPYVKTVIKKLYPNGDYYLETTTPVWNIDDDEIAYVTKKEFITNFDLKPCGCLDTTPLNTDNLIAHCPDIYCNYYAPCERQCNLSYGYKIFEESGLIQMDQHYPYEKVYVEYNGFISKIQGQYYVPMVSFETLVEWTKWKLIQNRKNYSLAEREWQKQNYIRERRNMEKVLGRISLYQIIQGISMLPKFDFDISNDWYGNFCYGSTGNSASLPASTSSSSSTVVNGNTFVNGTFVINVKVDGSIGHPVAGESTYQNNLLKNSSPMGWIFLAKQTFTELDGDYTINTTTGVLDISPNIFIANDSLIIPYNKTLS